MIDGTEKPKIPSKFAKHAARYNEFDSNSPSRPFENFYLPHYKFLIEQGFKCNISVLNACE